MLKKLTPIPNQKCATTLQNLTGGDFLIVQVLLYREMSRLENIQWSGQQQYLFPA